MKRAIVYQRWSVILVHPSSRTTEGVWILSIPCVRLPTDCSDAELGEARQSALEGSKASVPHPTQWNGVLEPLLKVADVGAWKTFAKSAVCVEVEQEADGLNLIPTINRGINEGFRVDGPKTKSIAMPVSPDHLGASLREAIRLCTRT